MARFSQRFVRSVIRLVWNQAGPGANTFREALNTGQSGQWQYVGTGWQVQSSSGAGYTTTFHVPSDPNDPTAMTPAILQELFEQLLEVYSLVSTQGAASTTGAPNVAGEGIAEDQADDAMSSVFVAAMWSYFPTIKGTTNNWMYLTW